MNSFYYLTSLMTSLFRGLRVAKDYPSHRIARAILLAYRVKVFALPVCV